MREEPSKNQNLVFIVNSQHEFWHREFQGDIYEKNDSYQKTILEVISLGYCPIFQIDNNLSEIQFLSTLPKDSIIVWCHSDESYDLKFNQQISEISAIKLILRPYRLYKFSFRKLCRAIVQTLINLQYAKSVQFVLKVVLWQIRGFSMQYRQEKIRKMYSRSQKSYINIVIGYTNVFAVSLSRHHEFSKVSTDKSLFDLLSPIQIEFGKCAITFSGQVGQVVRETALRALSKFPQAHLVYRDSYGASNILEEDVITKGAEYVDSLNQSRLILCPPGNISGESFRIFETILMRRIPVTMSSVTSDPNFELPFKFHGPWQSRVSWGGVIKEAISTETVFLRDLAQRNFDDYKDEIRRTRMHLENCAFSSSINEV